jgi:beta-glucosidase
VGFAAVKADPGETVTARIDITERALSRWTDDGWTPLPGPHHLRIGRSAADHTLDVEL